VTEHVRDVTPLIEEPIAIPGVFIVYEISPMRVRIEEHRKPFTHFLTNLCAIIGGVYTVAGLIDRLLFSAVNILQRSSDFKKLG
jgi:hypothetical protein